MKTSSIAIIGLGVISANYYQAIMDSQFQLIAVCDSSIEKYNSSRYTGYSYYSSCQQMLQTIEVDYVIIATPPDSHYEVAKLCLNSGVNVILEKPATATLAEYDSLVDIAEQNDRILDVMLHWNYGSEALYAIANVAGYGDIASMHITIRDNYASEGGHIEDSRVALGGTFVDSGINAVGLACKLLGSTDIQLLDAQRVIDGSCGYSMQSVHTMQVGICQLTVDIDWTRNISSKYTRMVTTEGVHIDIDHDAQSVIVDGVVVFVGDDMPRLPRHYYNYFAGYSVGNIDLQFVRRCHQLIFAERSEHHE